MPICRDFLDFDHQWKTYPFNLTDLIEPVPQSIYNKQPICAKQAVSWVQDSPGTVSGLSQLVSWSGTGDDWWSVTSNFDCPRTAPYKPIIAVPVEVRDFAPEWSSCTVWYGGLYDPPKALESQAAAATPTMPAAYSTTPASPSSTMQNTQPSQTASPPQTASAYQTSPAAESSTQSAAAPASYGSSFTESGDTEQTTPASSAANGAAPAPYGASSIDSSTAEQTSAERSQNAGGAIVSVIAGYSTSVASQDPSEASTASDPTAASSAYDPASATVDDPANTPVGYSTPSDPGVSSAISDPATSVVAIGEQTTIDNVVVSAGGSYGSSLDSASGGAAVVGGQTLQPAQATTIDGTQYSVSSDGAVIVALPTSAPQNAVSILSAAEQSATQLADPAVSDPNDASSVNTLDPGQTASVSAFPSASEEAVLTENSMTVTASRASGQTWIAVISGSTISAGGAPMSLGDGYAVSLASNGIVGASQTAAFSAVGATAGSSTVQVEAAFTAASQAYTATQLQGDSGEAFIESTTLSIGGPAMTIAGGGLVSLGSGELVEGTSTIAFSTARAPSGGSSSSSDPTSDISATRGITTTQAAAPSSTGVQNSAYASRSGLMSAMAAGCGMLIIMLL